MLLKFGFLKNGSMDISRFMYDHVVFNVSESVWFVFCVVNCVLVFIHVILKFRTLELYHNFFHIYLQIIDLRPMKKSKLIYFQFV